MRHQKAIHWARHPLLAATLLAAFFAHALIPTGFMPGPRGIVICHGYVPASGVVAAVELAAARIAIADAGQQSALDLTATGDDSTSGGSPHHDAGTLCPFAAAAPAIGNGAVAGYVLAVTFISAPIPLPRQPFIAGSAIVPTRLPRGPPAFA